MSLVRVFPLLCLLLAFVACSCTASAPSSQGALEPMAAPMKMRLARLQSSGGTDADAEAAAPASTPKKSLPAMPLAKPYDAKKLRQTLRGGADDKLVQGAATYTLFPNGVVKSVSVSDVSLKKRTPLGPMSIQYCDIAFDPIKFTRSRSLWQTGHIWASGLGGDDDDPLNFFPQHARSNGSGGCWWKTEMIAGSMKGALSSTLNSIKEARACKVSLLIQFTQPSPNAVNTLIPPSGSYTVSITAPCYAALQKMQTQGALDKFASIFALKAKATTDSKNYVITTNWKNAEDPVAKNCPNLL